MSSIRDSRKARDRRVSIERLNAQFDVSVGNCTRNYSRGPEDEEELREVLSQGCSEKIRKKDVVMTTGRWSS